MLTENQLAELRRDIRGVQSILRDALAGEGDIFTAAETAKQLSERALAVLSHDVPYTPAQ